VPYLVGVGNHEGGGFGSTKHADKKCPSTAAHYPSPPPDEWNFGDDSSGECGAMMRGRFLMPSRGVDNSPFWYSFNR
jgi:hypothetical protein